MVQDLYREVVLAHYRNPTNRRVLPGANAQISTNNPLCGDELTVFARVEDGRLADVAFDAVGCSIVYASADMMIDLVKGRATQEATRLADLFHDMLQGDEPDAGEELGEISVLREVRKFPVRVKCAMLPWTSLQQALAAWNAESSGLNASQVNPDAQRKTE